MHKVEATCPRCGTKLELRIEVELGNGESRRILYYYRCPRCTYRLQDAAITIKRTNGGLILELTEVVK